jgi:hypothetical protein
METIIVAASFRNSSRGTVKLSLKHLCPLQTLTTKLRFVLDRTIYWLLYVGVKVFSFSLVDVQHLIKPYVNEEEAGKEKGLSRNAGNYSTACSRNHSLPASITAVIMTLSRFAG